MRTVALPEDCSEEAFRAAARRCLAQNLAPEELLFTTGEAGALFGDVASADTASINVPRRFVSLMSDVICHSAEERFALLYRLLWRIRSGERDLLDRANDTDVLRATRLARAVTRDVYRMHAFVRFTERTIDGRAVFTAWFEPQHHVLRRAAPFFVDRFGNMDWLIATPVGSIAWRDKALTFGSAARPPGPGRDAVLDELWTTYYRTTFNPARLRVKAMVAQMPKRHWATMPETAQVPDLVKAAASRVRQMTEREPDAPPRFAAVLAERLASPPMPEAEPVERIRREAAACTRCPLHGPATQAVAGEGPPDAALVFVGEQPGDQEDLAGRPFVGPAGQLFDRALAEAGIERHRIYVTNAVKHFKFEPRGKRRIHKKPGTAEVTACRFWLQRELAAINPRLIVALGATATLGLIGRAVAVTKERGRFLACGETPVLVTVHPSYLLRLPDSRQAEAEYKRFVADLRLARPWCDGVPLRT